MLDAEGERSLAVVGARVAEALGVAPVNMTFLTTLRP